MQYVEYLKIIVIEESSKGMVVPQTGSAGEEAVLRRSDGYISRKTITIFSPTWKLSYKHCFV